MKAGQILKKIKLNKNKFIIRYLKYEDVNNLLEVVNSLVAEKSMLGPQKKFSRAKEEKWVKNVLHKILNKKAVYLVGELNGQVIGWASVFKGKFTNKKHIGQAAVSLRSEYRGRGLAKKLIKKAISEAKKHLKTKIIKLNVYAENKKAIKLYKSLGFERVGQIKKGRYHFGRYIDLIIMVKYL
ncbi:MAG: GNAT family N-acetyltransferase [Patescibacteria group bacterium]|nr:GNAT family N-acetyltransferase [Patescibacteria group bacterium]